MNSYFILHHSTNSRATHVIITLKRIAIILVLKSHVMDTGSPLVIQHINLYGILAFLVC
jgi:hypothetical protein